MDNVYNIVPRNNERSKQGIIQSYRNAVQSSLHQSFQQLRYQSILYLVSCISLRYETKGSTVLKVHFRNFPIYWILICVSNVGLEIDHCRCIDENPLRQGMLEHRIKLS